MNFQQFLLPLLLLVVSGRCAKILGIFNMPSISHQIVFQPIWKELSLRGHEVVIATPNPLNDPTLVNLTEISLEFLHSRTEDLRLELSEGMDHWKINSAFVPFVADITKQIFDNNKIQELLNGNETFDVVLVEALFPTPAVFAAKYKCPIVGIASLTVTNHIHQTLGTPSHPILYPDITTTYGDDMTFLQKIDAVLFDIWYRYNYAFELLPTLDKIIQEFFGNEAPSLLELEKSMSIVLLNSNPILHKPRPFGPNIIEMGGRMHIKSKKPLPTVRSKFTQYFKV